MRKRIAFCMVALVLVLLGVGMTMTVCGSFSMMMERERARALGEEAAISRAVMLENTGNMDANKAAALQSGYSSTEWRVYLLSGGETLTGEVLPQTQNLRELLETPVRATLLDRKSETLLIAHRLNDRLTLLTVLDVSPVYAMRTRMLQLAAVLTGMGILLSALLAAWLSGWLIRPIQRLADAALKLAQGKDNETLPEAKNDEIGVLIRAFSTMSAAIHEREATLKRQAEEQKLFTDALAHEMRTPLTAILGGARLLRQAKLSEEQEKNVLDTMAREAARLSQMDERLLLLTRLEHEEAVMKPFSSKEMAEEALSVFEGVRLEGESAVFVGERELMILMMRNLVVNAQRAGGKKPVCVTLYPDGFDVTDDGCGMTQEQIERAFKPFYKADKARSRNAGGVGLGLTLCQKIARIHHGKIEIYSELGKETRVCYRMDTTR